MIVDLRSDTVTKPCLAMREAMMNAETGDDVFREDPTVLRLEKKVAEMFGMEAALFCPSGTMTNQIAIRAHTGRLEEIICHELSHIYNYENGGYAFNSGVSIRLAKGGKGSITPRDIIENIQYKADWLPETKLVSIENTCNKGGGSIISLEEMKAVSECCKENNLKLHLDGARIFNALVELNEDPGSLEGLFDSISICFSKGLGAPVGSALLGSSGFMERSRKHRKAMGGGMRQAGYLAAACIYALDNNIERLKTDHEHARSIGKSLKESEYIRNVLPINTNIVIAEIKNISVEEFISKLEGRNIMAVPFGQTTVRFVTHLDVSPEMIRYVSEQIPLI